MTAIGSLLAMLLLADAQAAPEYVRRAPDCPPLREAITEPCVMPTRFDPQESSRKLGDRDYMWWIEDDRLTMIARPHSQPWMMLCCAISTALEPIAGSDLAAIEIRVPQIDEAVLDITAFPSETFREDMYRGTRAKPAPERLDPPAARLLTQTLPSRWLGENRVIIIYLPPGHDSAKALPTFYLADAQARVFAPIAEAAIAHGKMPPFIMVGLASASGDLANCSDMTCDRRGWEYKIDRNKGDTSAQSPFGRHIRFFVEEVIPFIEDRYPASRRVEDRLVGGSSNGAHWALAMAALRPDLFGKAMLLSSSGREPQSLAARLGKTRVFGGAGQYEPKFLAYTRATVEAAVAAGAETHMTIEVSGHSQAAWDMMFAEGAPWLLKRAERKSGN